jgi:hypothetical protein
MTLVNYFPDFLLLLRDVQGQSQSVAQRQADAKSAQVAIGKALDTLRYEPLFLSFRHCCSFFSIPHACCHLTLIKLGVCSNGLGPRIQLR